MRRFIIELLITTLVLTVVIPLLPGIQAINPTLWLYLAMGLALSLFSRLLKPVLFVLTGRLVIWNIGLWITILNIIIFILAGWLFRDRFEIAGSLWLIVGAVLVSAITTAVDALLGFDRPNLDPNKNLPVWRFIERLTGYAFYVTLQRPNSRIIWVDPVIYYEGQGSLDQQSIHFLLPYLFLFFSHSCNSLEFAN
jgi:uncharacterized membrane protein YvlD (DUF360 family)